MPHSVIRLHNGLRIVHEEVASPISHFGVLVNAGTRDELPQQMGIAHFVEHTIFKGTQKRNAFRVLSRMETVGGDLNACTYKEETDFHTSFPSSEYERAVELLSDVLFNSTFPEKELEKEKTVVQEEISFYKDSPSEQIFDDFEDLVFEGHPLGKNILGTKQSVKKFKRKDILSFMERNYTLENIVLASAGNISTAKLVRLCERYFGSHEIKQVERERAPFENYVPKIKHVNKNISQTNVLLGNLSYCFKDDKRTPFLLLTNILGGDGMNTRLNLSVREKRGLAYSIESYYTVFSDMGLFSIYYGCDPHNRDHCLEIIQKELKKIREEKLGTMQLYYAKKQLIGRLALSNESKINEMLTLGHSAFYYDEIDTMEESNAEINAVTADQILEVANEILVPEKFSMLTFDPR